jgi:predicted DNA-binding transcriptional regulator YafY
MRIERLLAITIMLLSRRSVTAARLAERFDISVRTVYRDIEALNAAGIPVVSYQGAGGGYCLMENYRIDRQVFSLDDMVSILAAFKGINASLSHERFEQIIDKIDSLIPADKKSRLRRQIQPLAFDLSPWGPTSHISHYMSQIYEAIVETRLIAFSYYDFAGAQSRRTVEPLTILCKSFAWYCFGYCRLRRDFRMFKLARMRDVVTLSERFSPREASYKECLFAHEKPPHLTKITLLFPERRRAHVEEYYHETDIHCMPDGALRVVMEIPEDEWVYGMLLSYGPDVEVLAPEHIRGIIADRAEKIKKIYQT